MGIKDRIKKNTVSTRLSDMKVTIAGRPKAGKTSLFYEILKREGGLDTGLLFAFEKGYNFLDGINVVDIESWADFVDVIDELEEDNEGFKYVGIDTIDIAGKLCREYVLKKASSKEGKRFETIGDIPFGKGYELEDAEFAKQFQRIDKIFGGWMAITHDKDKTVKERSGLEYDKTMMSATGRTGDYIKNSSDFIVFIDIEKEKARDKETRKTGVKETRKIRFRGDGTTEAGGRISNLPEIIDYDVDKFLETIAESVKSAISAPSEKKEEKKSRITKNKKDEPKDDKVEDEKPQLDIKDIKAQMKAFLDTLEVSEKREWGKVFKSELGVLNYAKSEDAEALANILKDMTAKKEAE